MYFARNQKTKTMNKFLTFIFLLFIFISCEKEQSEISIVGTWEAISFTVSNPIDENGDGIENKDYLKEDNCITWIIDFFENGALNIKSTQSVNDYDIVNNKLVIVDTYCDESKISGTWDLNDSGNLLNLTLKIPDEDDLIVNLVVVIERNRLTFLDFPFDPDEFISIEIEFRKI